MIDSKQADDGLACVRGIRNAFVGVFLLLALAALTWVVLTF